MKITQAYKNRAEIEAACKAARACKNEYTALRKAANKIDFENVLYRNFSWCVQKDILAEWLPKAAPNAKTVYARGCTGLTELAAPNAEYVDARGCTGLTELAAPNAKTVYASGCTGLTEKKKR